MCISNKQIIDWYNLGWCLYSLIYKFTVVVLTYTNQGDRI